MRDTTQVIWASLVSDCGYERYNTSYLSFPRVRLRVWEIQHKLSELPSCQTVGMRDTTQVIWAFLVSDCGYERYNTSYLSFPRVRLWVWEIQHKLSELSSCQTAGMRDTTQVIWAFLVVRLRVWEIQHKLSELPSCQTVGMRDTTQVIWAFLVSDCGYERYNTSYLSFPRVRLWV